MAEMTFGNKYRLTGSLPPGDAIQRYAAVDATGANVVIDVVSPREQTAFQGRVQRAAAMAHPHLARVLDWGAEGGYCYVVSEPVEGVDLATVLSTGEALPAQTVAAYGAQVASALAAVHGRSLVHGGVDPRNLIRTPDGTIKLTAFGIRRAGLPLDLTEEAPPEDAWYVSPEEAFGRQPGPAADLYCLGVVLYQLSTGRLPFDGPNAFAVSRLHVEAPVEPPRRVKPDLPPSLENVILRALAKNPEDRYGSAEEMRQDLERVVAGQQVAAPRASVAAPRRRRALWPLAATVAIMLAALLAFAWASGWLGGGGAQVPDLQGKTLDQAQVALTDAGLKLGEVTYATGAGPDMPDLTVVDQSPDAGADVDEGDVVDITLGSELVTLPDVRGMTETQATSTLLQAGFKIDQVTQVANKDVPVGQVVDQTPQAGAQVPPGSLVTLVVSLGDVTPTVPDVTGATQDAATRLLESAGYQVTAQPTPSDTVPAGSVIGQAPAAGVKAEAGTTVTIFVSTGPTATPTPSPSLS